MPTEHLLTQQGAREDLKNKEHRREPQERDRDEGRRVDWILYCGMLFLEGNLCFGATWSDMTTRMNLPRAFPCSSHAPCGNPGTIRSILVLLLASLPWSSYTTTALVLICSGKTLHCTEWGPENLMFSLWAYGGPVCGPGGLQCCSLWALCSDTGLTQGQWSACYTNETRCKCSQPFDPYPTFGP